MAIKDGVQILKLVPEVQPNNPTVYMRWCVDPIVREELAEQLRAKKLTADDLYLLLIVWSERGHVEERRLVELDQLMEAIVFTRPGKNRVLATIAMGKKPELEKKWLRLNYSKYETSMINQYSDGQFQHDPRLWDCFIGQDTADFQMDEAFFARMPSAAEKWWVNLWFGGRMPQDQCAFRKRRIVAYSIQPPIMAIGWMLKSLVMIGGAIISNLLLLRNEFPNLRAILQPWNYPIQALYLDDKKHDMIERGLWFLAPGVWLFAAMMAYTMLMASKLATLGHVLTLTAVIVGLGLVIHVAVYAVRQMIKHFRAAAAEPVPTDQLLLQLDQELSELSCRPGLKASLASLPARKRTFHLRFMDTKRAVCRPFARS